MSNYNSAQGYALDWDSEIQQDGSNFTPLPEGDYRFQVVSFERGTYDGGAKIPACKKASLELRVDGGELGAVSIKHNLFLHSSVEGLLSSFFVSIGQKKKGERVTMNWGAVIGAEGRARIGTRKYKNKDGEDRQINEVKYFIDAPDGSDASAPASASSAPPQANAAPLSGYQPGKF